MITERHKFPENIASTKVTVMGLTIFIAKIVYNVNIFLKKIQYWAPNYLRKLMKGWLLTGQLENSECTQIRKEIETISSILALHGDIKPVIIDTWFSVTDGGSLEGFEKRWAIISESLTRIGCKIKSSNKERIIKFELITKKDDVVIAKTRDMYATDIHCRFFSSKFEGKGGFNWIIWMLLTRVSMV